MCPRTHGHDLTDDFMAHRQRQVDVDPTQLQRPALAHVIEAVANMHVAVADTARRHAHQHFRVGRLRRGLPDPLQRLAPLENLVAFHRQATARITDLRFM